MAKASRGVEFRGLTVSLKRYPDTKPEIADVMKKGQSPAQAKLERGTLES
jgi:hypothetical protein